MNRRTFLTRSALTLGASAVGCFAYATEFEPHWLEIAHRDLAVENLPPALAGATLAQLSDLHIGPQVADAYIIHTFDRLRALAPDIVVITGDFLTHRTSRGEAQFAQLRFVLSHLPHGRLATLGILGNHDYGHRWADTGIAARVMDEGERAGVHMLRNASRNIAGLDFVGIDDLWSRRGNPPAALAERSGDAAIVLMHNPDAADQQEWPGFRGWMLAGHTHGGQCKPPFLPPPLLPVENRRYVAGEVSVDDDRTLYISRGVGHLIKARFLVRPEMTLFTLRAGAKSS